MISFDLDTFSLNSHVAKENHGSTFHCLRFKLKLLWAIRRKKPRESLPEPDKTVSERLGFKDILDLS